MEDKEKEVLSMEHDLGIERTYMSVFTHDHMNEILISFEQLTSLIRQTLHATPIKKITDDDIFYKTPSYRLDDIIFNGPQEECRKYKAKLKKRLMDYLDCLELRESFRANMTIRFCVGNEDCLWNILIARIIMVIYEICQLHAINMDYSDGVGDLSRKIIMLSDFRMDCKLNL